MKLQECVCTRAKCACALFASTLSLVQKYKCVRTVFVYPQLTWVQKCVCTHTRLCVQGVCFYPQFGLEQECICTHTSVCTLLLPSACSSVIQPSRQMFPLSCEFFSGWSCSVFSCRFGDSSVAGVPDKPAKLWCSHTEKKWKGHTIGERACITRSRGHWERTQMKASSESVRTSERMPSSCRHLNHFPWQRRCPTSFYTKLNDKQIFQQSWREETYK